MPLGNDLGVFEPRGLNLLRVRTKDASHVNNCSYTEEIPMIFHSGFDSFLSYFRVFFGDGENVKNFRYDIFLARTTKHMEILIKYLDSLTDFT